MAIAMAQSGVIARIINDRRGVHLAVPEAAAS
jgi:hypothetical protein